MSDRGNIKRYGARVKREAVLKALLIGLTAGASAATLTELISWFVGFKEGLYVALGLLVVITTVLTVALYFAKFRPSAKAVAARIDGIGLEERVLTMMGMEGNDSYIAKAQREDTRQVLEKTKHTMLKFNVAASLIIAVTVMCFVMTRMTALSGLAYAGIIPSGPELLNRSKVNVYYVNYTVRDEEAGKIYYVTGHWEQPELFGDRVEVAEGEDAPAVIAVANEGYVFTGWSDGAVDPLRQDAALKGNVDVFALFRSIADDVEDDADPESDGISAPQTQSPPPQSSDDPNGGGNNPSDGSGSGRTENRNQIVDGSTYYGDNYGDAMNEAYDSMNGENVDNNYKDAASGYLDALDPGSEDSDGE